MFCRKSEKISVLLTSYNSSKTVHEAIESVLQQTYKNFELILLDDNSNKKTLKVLSRYLDNPKVKFYQSHATKESKKKICPYARQINVGLEMATGKYITYLCDDDLYMPDRFEVMVSYFKKNPKVRVCYGRQGMHNLEDNTFIGVRKPDRILRDPACKIDHCSVMHYKSCVNKVGNWDTFSFTMADAHYWRKLGKYFPFYPIFTITDIHRFNHKSISATQPRKSYAKINKK